MTQNNINLFLFAEETKVLAERMLIELRISCDHKKPDGSTLLSLGGICTLCGNMPKAEKVLAEPI